MLLQSFLNISNNMDNKFKSKEISKKRLYFSLTNKCNDNEDILLPYSKNIGEI